MTEKKWDEMSAAEKSLTLLSDRAKEKEAKDQYQYREFDKEKLIEILLARDRYIKLLEQKIKLIDLRR